MMLAMPQVILSPIAHAVASESHSTWDENDSLVHMMLTVAVAQY